MSKKTRHVLCRMVMITLSLLTSGTGMAAERLGATSPLSQAPQRKADGTVPYGHRLAEDKREGPWFVKVPGHLPVEAREHPRLLFRQADLPRLKAKASTPEGRTIVARLRYLLDGGKGQGMPSQYSQSRKAYSRLDEKLPAGSYTLGHAAGYGLLYQLTGEPKYAEFGRQCFELALNGQRDRDDRYSFRNPGGPLRAGPTLGWMAVGYDLCYNGWDEATREKFGLSLFKYQEETLKKGEHATRLFSLPDLVKGTMPPYSNHFGMQVGGAALVLLALRGEAWAPESVIDPLLEQSAHSMIRNLSEGFGDGGFFAEGDGTGSMSSQIVFLTALQAWRNVEGRDFINSPRPNARMLTLKWAYQTVFREGKPDFWPIRGGYGQNVWAREGQSGAAYFALGMGSVPEAERSALLWCYNHFLSETDTKRGTPFDTASLYPQFALTAFLNWPVGEPELPPSKVLPHVYRDSVSGFYCWRDRWQDANDTVITVLTDDTRGYMGAKAETTLSLNTGGKHLTWGTVSPGQVRHWWTSATGQTSSLTLADGTCIGVDFTGASGSGILLVTTGKAAGQSVQVGGQTLTFSFPGSTPSPLVELRGNETVVGEQRIDLKDGNLVFSVLENTNTTTGH